jgi:hypothetical protein
VCSCLVCFDTGHNTKAAASRSRLRDVRGGRRAPRSTRAARHIVAACGPPPRLHANAPETRPRVQPHTQCAPAIGTAGPSVGRPQQVRSTRPLVQRKPLELDKGHNVKQRFKLGIMISSFQVDKIAGQQVSSGVIPAAATPRCPPRRRRPRRRPPPCRPRPSSRRRCSPLHQQGVGKVGAGGGWACRQR